MALLVLVHLMVPLALVQNLVIRWRHLHWFQSLPPGGATSISKCAWIALLVSSARIELVSSSTRDTSDKSAKHYLETPGPIDQTPGIPGSDNDR